MTRTTAWIILVGTLGITIARDASADAPPPPPRLVHIEAGSFDMGIETVPLPEAIIKGARNVNYDRTSREGDYDEVPVHRVTIAHGFEIATTEVTIEQYRQFK